MVETLFSVAFLPSSLLFLHDSYSTILQGILLGLKIDAGILWSLRTSRIWRVPRRFGTNDNQLADEHHVSWCCWTFHWTTLPDSHWTLFYYYYRNMLVDFYCCQLVALGVFDDYLIRIDNQLAAECHVSRCLLILSLNYSTKLTLNNVLLLL
jgi:hypothetical protein